MAPDSCHLLGLLSLWDAAQSRAISDSDFPPQLEAGVLPQASLRQTFAQEKAPRGLLLSLLCDLGRVSLSLHWGQSSACARLPGVSKMMAVKGPGFLIVAASPPGGLALG